MYLLSVPAQVCTCASRYFPYTHLYLGTFLYMYMRTYLGTFRTYLVMYVLPFICVDVPRYVLTSMLRLYPFRSHKHYNSIFLLNERGSEWLGKRFLAHRDSAKRTRTHQVPRASPFAHRVPRFFPPRLPSPRLPPPGFLPSSSRARDIS
jgi:hypothetical protein